LPQFPAAAAPVADLDQGKEMALHQEVAAAPDMPVYFCDKASPWQRTVEREH
jgi:IS30 family transposase